MVSQIRGHHVLPNQDLRSPLLPPDRREPLGKRTTTATSPRHPGTARSAPAVRPTRCPAGLGRSLGPVRPTAFRPRQGPTPHHRHPPHRTRPDLPATLATDRLPARPRPTPGGTPLRVRCRAGDLPDRPAPPVRTRQRPGGRQVESELPDRGV